MPLVRATLEQEAAEPAARSDDPADLAAELRSEDDAVRRDAARRAAQRHPEVLFEALDDVRSADLLELILSQLTTHRAEMLPDRLAEMLADPEPTRRNRAVDCLTAMGAEAEPAIARALRSNDADVRIQALAVVPSLPAERAEALLIDLLGWEPDPNACNCALEALLQVGTHASQHLIAPLSQRFAQEPSIEFALVLLGERLAEDAP
ncbi:MAG: hypothetical protein AAF074_03690 [Pseudomonadota bacterium]